MKTGEHRKEEKPMRKQTNKHTWRFSRSVCSAVLDENIGSKRKKSERELVFFLAEEEEEEKININMYIEDRCL